jgi:copper oxidase (laccase) domain-containing protein
MIREKVRGKMLVYSTKKEGNMSFKFDNPSQVLENRKRFFIKKLKLKFNQLIFLQPKGRNKIALATKSLTELKPIKSPHGWYNINVDGLILSDKLKRYCIVLLTADCVPLFILDKNGEYFGLIHINRNNVDIIKALKRKLKSLQLSFQDIYVHIGPSIFKHSYLHSLPIDQQLIQEWQPFLKYISKNSQPDKVMIDLKGMVIKKLKEIGITSISDSNLDTGNSRSSFFSHRLAKDKLISEGRFVALILSRARDKI